MVSREEIMSKQRQTMCTSPGCAKESAQTEKTAHDNSQESATATLHIHRKAIDALDAELLRLLNQRARIAHELASIKKSSGLPVYDSEREQQILNRICEENRGPLASQSVASIFRCIIRESRRVEETSMRKLNNNIFKQENHNGHQHGSRRVRG